MLPTDEASHDVKLMNRMLTRTSHQISRTLEAISNVQSEGDNAIADLLFKRIKTALNALDKAPNAHIHVLIPVIANLMKTSIVIDQYLLDVR